MLVATVMASSGELDATQAVLEGRVPVGGCWWAGGCKRLRVAELPPGWGTHIVDAGVVVGGLSGLKKSGRVDDEKILPGVVCSLR